MKLEIADSFYQEEERCGYLVSAHMKKVWAVELDLLYQLDQVCNKYGITYYASGGTILSAERHKGFIPWDDDIDVMMLRDQYDLLCAHADEFEDPYFFQTGDTDEGYFRGHAQLRNSNTTGVLLEEVEKNVPDACVDAAHSQQLCSPVDMKGSFYTQEDLKNRLRRQDGSRIPDHRVDQDRIL